MTISPTRAGGVLSGVGPEHADYAALTTGYQLGYALRPDLVVAARTPADVADAVAAAAATRTPLTVQATGHGLSGDRSGGVLVHTGAMDAVTVDPRRHTARVQAGARWADVIAAAAPHGLAPLSGSAPGVGAVGYTLEGGVGLLGRTHGFAADHVRSLDVVTAAGEPVVADAQNHPELFWALRGGGGNFGVVTAMEIALFEVPALYGGGLYLPGESAAEVLAAWAEWTATQPVGMNSSIGLIPFPDLAGVPEPLRGRHIAHVRVAFLGGEAEAESLLAPLRTLGTPLVDTLRPMTYAESGQVYNDPPAPMAYYATNVLVDMLTADRAGLVADATRPGGDLPCVLQVNHMGGALADAPEQPGAVAHRPARHAVRVLSRLTSGAGEPVAAALRERHDALYRDLGVPDGDLVLNFLLGGPVTPDQVRRGYLADDFTRLTGLKHRHDPDRILTGYHPIPDARA